MPPFSDVPRTPRGHLGLLFYETAYGIARHLGPRATSFPFLGTYLGEIRSRFPDPEGWQIEIRRWEKTGRTWLPLLARDLNDVARSILVTIGLVEEDAGFASLFAALQAPLGARRPTVGLLRELHGELWHVMRELIDAGYVEVVDTSAPRAEWVLRVPSPVWNAVRGEPSAEPMAGVRYHAARRLRTLRGYIGSEATRTRLSEVGALMRRGRVRTLIVRGPDGADRLAAVGAVARSLRQGLLEVTGPIAPGDDRLRLLGPLATLTRAIPTLALDLGPAETYTLPTLPGYRGPMAIMVGEDGGVAGASDAAHIEVQPDGPGTRLTRWTRELRGHVGGDLAAIAEQSMLSGRHIAECARLATTAAALDRRSTVNLADVRSAARAMNRQWLDALATRLGSDDGSADRLVVGQSTALELAHLEARCRRRERLADTLGHGFPGGSGLGVRALFEGPSGTGKTLAARALASAIGLDIYRVDLAAVFNKYVGETEKNLSRVLSRGEALDIVLLLDEGDALMTRRTEVRSSNDRYANVETNYLLQRLETYRGIVIVTTNFGDNIDAAFRRRMDVVVRFHMPDATERYQLWQVHLTHAARVDDALLEWVALRFALTGGQIRNAAVHATLLAVSQGSVVDRECLVSAIRREYHKAGAAFPEPSTNGPSPDERRAEMVAAFLGAVT